MASNNIHLKNFYNNIMKKAALMLPYQFTVEFVEGGVFSDGEQFEKIFTGTGGKNEKITYYAQSATLPGVTITPIKTNFFSQEYRQPGNIKYNHDWQIKFLLTEDMFIYNKMNEWQDKLSNLSNDGGGNKTIPNISMRINLLDSTQKNVKNSFILAGVWVSNVEQLALGYENNSTLTDFGVTLKYQYFYNEDENVEGDPFI